MYDSTPYRQLHNYVLPEISGREGYSALSPPKSATQHLPLLLTSLLGDKQARRDWVGS